MKRSASWPGLPKGFRPPKIGFKSRESRKRCSTAALKLERVLDYERVHSVAKLAGEQIAGSLNHLRVTQIPERVFSCAAPRVVPSEPEEEPTVHAAVLGRANPFYPLNRHFGHHAVGHHGSRRGVIVVSDVDLLRLFGGPQRQPLPPARRAGRKRNISLSPQFPAYKETFRRRSALLMTDTELNVMAALAMIGLSSSPNQGYRTPAARGIPSVL